MRTILKFAIVSLAFFVSFSSVAVSCKKDNGSTSETGITGGSSFDGTTLNVIEGGKTSCVIVYKNASGPGYIVANALKNEIKDLTGVSLSIISDSKTVAEYEIIVGKTDRTESAAALKEVGNDGFSIQVIGKKIVINGTDDLFLSKASDYFQKNILSNSAKAGKGFLKVTAADDHIEKSVPMELTMANLIKAGSTFSLNTKLVGACPAVGSLIVGQGACSDGTYVYIVNRTSDDSGAVVYKYRLSDFTLVGQTVQFNGGHCNDMTFDNDNNRVVLAHGQSEGKILTMIDAATMRVTGNVDIPVGSGAITYNANKKQYAISQGGTTLYIADPNFNVLKSFARSDKTGYTAQGMGSDDDYIYFPMSGSKDNILVVYDWNGNYVRTITVNTTMESESLFFVNGTYYINFYKSYHLGSELYKLEYVLN